MVTCRLYKFAKSVKNPAEFTKFVKNAAEFVKFVKNPAEFTKSVKNAAEFVKSVKNRYKFVQKYCLYTLDYNIITGWYNHHLYNYIAQWTADNFIITECRNYILVIELYEG